MSVEYVTTSGSMGGVAARMCSRTWGTRCMARLWAKTFRIVLQVMVLHSMPRARISSYMTMILSGCLQRPLRRVEYVTVFTRCCWLSSSQHSCTSPQASSAQRFATNASTMQPRVMAVGCTPLERISRQSVQTRSTSRARPKALIMEPNIGAVSARLMPRRSLRARALDSMSSRPARRHASSNEDRSTSSMAPSRASTSSRARVRSVPCAGAVMDFKRMEQVTA
mmetsp:Transcript_33637/g.96258  ORF Transcript_33637/g.96258 Transcript_33637/m.96258 type:complete len:224 (+) Transcript_33637:861-1532(+)